MQRNHQTFSPWHLILGLLVAGGLLTGPAHAQTQAKPNVVFVLVLLGNSETGHRESLLGFIARMGARYCQF